MTHPIRNRSRLMGGSASTALALALVLAPDQAAAQGIQADGTVVFGGASISDPGPGQTRIDLVTQTVVIDWTPNEDVNGDALDFIAAGASAEFRHSQISDFAVLNRILPSTNNNIMTINGEVLSRFVDGNGLSTPAGMVAFYSPTGILIGSTATFDVGSLLLTTLDIQPTAFQNFALGGNMTMVGASGSTARVLINPGAQILATPENAFFAVVAADIEMRGTALVNGSHAFVAGEVVNLSFSNGLFNISVPVGTAASGQVVTVDGTVGGPSSNGVGDNHMIYGVAHASADPISMLFSGNLGFDPAVSAGIVNGEIILAANYNVFGRFVAGGTISDGISATFRQTEGTTDVRADIGIANVTASSSILAIGTHGVVADSVDAASSVTGNLLLVGRESARLNASDGGSFTISGDVLVDSRDYGVVSSSLQSLDEINAQGGTAEINAFAGSTVTINGSALVSADAFAGAEDINRIAGSALGGLARIRGLGGTVAIGGDATLSARGLGTTLSEIETGAEARGGIAEILASQGGTASIGQDLTVLANATGASGSLFSASSVSNAYGGQARVSIFEGGGTLTVGGAALVDASARGGSANAAGAGSIGDAGEAVVSIDGPGLMTFGEAVRLEAIGVGGENAGGIGGLGLGGRASAVTFSNGTIGMGAGFDADASGEGGNGQSGGTGLGGIAGAIATLGQITIGGNGLAAAEGVGGDASYGFGGTGGIGRGGNAAFQATGSLAQTAILTIEGDAVALAQGFGGRGGNSDGSTIAAGRGGDGYGGQFSVPNQADPAFNSGAFILAGGDNGQITVGGFAEASARGFGGDGGSGSSFFAGGRGGDAFGGLAQAGLALLGFDGSVGLGTASFGTLIVQGDAFGGSGGFTFGDFPSGDGGDATGGNAFLTVRAGEVTADQLEISADARGGQGALGGFAQGGNAGILGSLGGTLTANRALIQARAFGGTSGFDIGGDAVGGVAAIESSGSIFTINGDAVVDASGEGGEGNDARGGNGTGGEAYITASDAATAGRITITEHAQVFANGVGGFTFGDFAAGDGLGGLARIEALSGGEIALTSTQVTAIGQGGFAFDHEGGNGTGGIVRLRASDVGSAITILRNIPQIQTETLGGGFMFNANGEGADTRGGSGIGGTGRGGVLEIRVQQGGAVTLPTNVAADPDAAAPAMFFVARGFGGVSEVDDGVGGAAFGGSGLFEVDGTGSTLISGETVLSVYAEGGSSASSTNNVTGGNAIGGTRIIRITNGGEATLQMVGGGAGGVGGNGSGGGNGGNAVGGANSVEIISGTLNAIGEFAVFDQTTGGNGVIGGSAQSGDLLFTASDADINLLPDASGLAQLFIGGTTLGGTGSAAGGFARSANVTVNLTNSSLNGGALQITPVAAGGEATDFDGVGGDAVSGQIAVNLVDSGFSLFGESVIAATAVGGSGGFDGQGGSATTGAVDVIMSDSFGTVQTSALGVPGSLRVASNAFGGQGTAIGNATTGRASLSLNNSSLTADQVLVSAEAFSVGQSSQAIGGIATAGQALLALSQSGSLDADVIELVANAIISPGGTAIGGSAAFQIASGSNAVVNANVLRLLADGSGGFAGASANGAGVFSVNVGGGNLNLGSLEASAQGDVLIGDPPASELVASGGNINVAGALSAIALGDISVRTAQGGIIGSPASGGTNTAIAIATSGSIAVEDDNSGLVGLGGASISLAAGGSILLGGNMATENGAVTIVANNGTALPAGSPTTATITATASRFIDAGSGTVTVRMGDGGGVTGRQSGAITLANITAGLIDVRNFGNDPGSDIVVLGSGVLTASGSGRAIDLASLNGEVINLHGDAGLILTGGGHYGVFAATPTGSQIGSFANYARRYNIADESAYDALNPGGNFAAFRIAPVLTVTADDITRFYGNVTPGLTASITGFQPGDSIADLLGAPELTTLANGTSEVGLYAILAALGTLASDQGYQFNFAPGQLTVVPRPITIAANNLSRIYGNANPALTFTVGGLGLVNGDQLSGALATAANATTGVGTAAITQGTLAASANYAVTFVNGTLTITPRPITVTADSFSRIYGNANPALTFTVGGLGLVNGDQLSGALATAANATTGVGTAAITQGTLAASANYAVTFVNGTLTITPRPITITADNLAKFAGQPDPALTFTVGGDGLVNNDTLTGALVREAGETLRNFAIRIGSLSAGPNYNVTFVEGTLTINPPPAPPEVNNPISLNPAMTPTDPMPTPEQEEEARFGIDFPSQPDAPLIEEEVLLDEPVTSGGDPTLYSSGVTPPAGGQ